MKNNHKGTPEELRRRAEEKVIADKSVSAAQERVTPAETLAAIETQRLLHELQVHQVELEMQNEELRFSQRDLETANEHYRTLIDNVPGITYTFSAKHGGQFYSPQVEQVFGYPLQDFYDDPLLWKNSIHPADKENVEHAIRNDGEKNQSGLSLEYRVRIKSGEWIWLRDCIFQRREVDDDIIIFGIAQDITDYKTAEDARKESQQQLLMAQEIGKTGSWIYNLETNKIWGSAEGFRMYGFPPIAGHISVDDIEACIPERERVHQTLVRLIRGEGEYDIEFAINPADGSPAKTVHSVARLSQDENGAPKVFGFVQDITERIRMEEVQHEASRQLAARTNALQRLTHQQSIIFDNAGVGIAHVQNRRFIRINPALCSMFGYDPDEITGADTRIIYPSQEDYEQTGRDAYAVLDGGGTFSRELILQRKDGTLFHALYNGKAIDPAEPQAGSIWIISDETEYFELKESLQKSHDLLATLSRQLPGLIYQYRLYPDDRSCFPYVSDTISEMFGVSPEDIREDAAPLFARIHPDDLDELRESIAESARTMEFWEHDFRVKLSHYRISWCHGFSRPEQLAVGSILWHGFISDIT
ncbi:MAG TPA: PAS domain-containing protein, partial [Desulfuromonadales bacterium]|nr:PAS domain-containing protein [Desulfuromonadales bacterium]